MARRAALFSALRAGRDGAAVFLAGPGEFLERGGPPVNATDNAFTSPGSLSVFASILFGLKYDLGVLAPWEADSLAARKTAWPGTFVPAREMSSRVLDLPDGRKMGVIVLPPLAEGQEAPGEDVAQALARAAGALRSKCGLVAAISPWGYLAENAYLTRQAPPAVDVLLGAGPGPATAQTAAGDKVLWLRTYTRGKAVQTVTIRDWPGENRNFAWTRDGFAIDTMGLDDSRPSDPDINARLAGINQ